MPLTDDLKKFSPCEIKKQLKAFEKEVQDLFDLEARKQEIEGVIAGIEEQIEGLGESIENKIEDEIEYYEKGIQDGIDSIKAIPGYFEDKVKDLEKRLKDIEDELRKPCDE